MPSSRTGAGRLWVMGWRVERMTSIFGGGADAVGGGLRRRGSVRDAWVRGGGVVRRVQVAKSFDAEQFAECGQDWPAVRKHGWRPRHCVRGTHDACSAQYLQLNTLY